MRRASLMNKTKLDGVWKDGRCRHTKPRLHLYGILAQLECNACNQEMLFRLKFGRPKTFEVAINNRPVGHATIHDTQQFINSHSTGIIMPDEQTVQGLGHPMRDNKMLEMLIDTLFPLDLERLRQCPIGDYDEALHSIPCRHESMRCQIYGDTVGITCGKCKVILQFRLVNDGTFNVRMTYDSPIPAEYGVHKIREVVDTIQKSVDTLGIPNMMADSMSDDPERDAYGMAKIVRLFTQYGLLECGRSDNVPPLNVMGCSRADFERICESSDTERRILERTRISWPYKITGRGVRVSHYNITGSAQYCVRCSFSTLDTKDDNWKDGCPHCGYGGYLLDLQPQ